MKHVVLSGDQIAALGIDDWRSMYNAIEARFRTRNFATGLEFVNAIGSAAEAANHHPDIDLRYSVVNVLITDHEAGGKTQRDVDLARRISALAAERDITADPASTSRLELALDTWDIDAVRPFWAAVLGLEDPGHGDEVRDPEGSHPTIWFQETDEHRTPRQRFHLDIRVPPEVARARIEAGIAAGGTLVSEDEAPRFTILADPQGNKICICTHLTRSN